MPRVKSPAPPPPKPKGAAVPKAARQRRWGLGELCAELGVTREALRQWVLRGCPRHEDGTFRLEAVVAWREAEAAAKAAAKAASKATPTTEDEARARKLSAEAELAEVKLARERGQVITIEDAAAEYERRTTRLRQAVAAVPGTYAQQIVGLETTAEAMRVLRDVVASLLAALQPEGV